MINLKKIFSKVGPGFITGFSDDDPSGILTYLQAGVVLGTKGLWLVLFTLPLMYGIQEMVGRIGLVTDKGLMKLIKLHHSRPVFMSISLLVAGVIILNISADMLAVGVVIETLFRIPPFLTMALVGLFIIFGITFLSYRRFANILKWLGLSLLFYIIALISFDTDWARVLVDSVIPSFEWSRNTALILVAILGTTISPYMFFWQASEEVEERDEKEPYKSRRFLITNRRLVEIKKDTLGGMMISNIVMWFVIAAASQIGQTAGLLQINDFNDASLVLTPVMGKLAFLAFGLGIIGTGLLSIPVLAGSAGYVIAEVFNLKEGLNKRFKDAKLFYLIIALVTVGGYFLNILRLNVVEALILTAVLYAAITPIIIYFILKIANNKKIMKTKTNSHWSNLLGLATLITMTAAALIYVYYSFLP